MLSIRYYQNSVLDATMGLYSVSIDCKAVTFFWRAQVWHHRGRDCLRSVHEKPEMGIHVGCPLRGVRQSEKPGRAQQLHHIRGYPNSGKGPGLLFSLMSPSLVLGGQGWEVCGHLLDISRGGGS